MPYEADTIKQLMTLVDENQSQLSEGDYLKTCNAIKTLHDNCGKRFPLQSILEFKNRDAIESCEESIKVEKNELKYLTEQVQSNIEEMCEIENQMKTIHLQHGKKNTKTKIKLKRLGNEMEHLKRSNELLHEKIRHANHKITLMRNKIANYKQLNPEDICEQFHEVKGEYLCEDTQRLAKRCIHNANLKLLNTFSKIYTRINGIDWLQHDMANDYIIDEIYTLEDELDLIRRMFIRSLIY